MTEFVLFNAKTNKQAKHKEREKSLTTLDWNAVTLRGIYLYTVLFLFLFIQFLECSC